MNNSLIISVILFVFTGLSHAEINYTEDYLAGVNVNGQWDSAYNLPDAIAIADWLPGINANVAAVQVTLWQQNLTSNAIWEAKIEGSNGCSTLSPSQDSIKAYIDLLHGKGLKVILKFHVNVVGWCNNVEGLWSGKINPDSPDAWFNSYERKVIEYATIAQEKNVEIFAFGNELAGLSQGYEQEWKDLIRKIRLIYKGKLIYCAAFPNDSNVNDAEYARVVFWNLVDYIGINLWPQASQKKTPTVSQIKESYFVFKTKLDEWYDSNGFNKKIVITEYGVPNTDYCVSKPWDSWTYRGTTNETCQTNAYEAFFQVFSPDRRITGIVSHEDLVDHLYDDQYQVRGRDSERIVSKWFFELIEQSPVEHNGTKSIPWVYLLLLSK